MGHGCRKDGLVHEVVERDGKVVIFFWILHLQETEALFDMLLVSLPNPAIRMSNFTLH